MTVPRAWYAPRMRLMALTLTLAAALIAPAAAPANLVADQDGNAHVPAITRMAEAAAGMPLDVVCAPTSPEYDGWTWASENEDGTTYVEPVVYVSGDRCGALDALLRNAANLPTRKPRHPRLYEASVAIATVVHESMHVRLQSGDETLVECVAMANVWPVVKALDVPPWARREIMLNVLDNHEQLPLDYLGPCPEAKP